MTQVATSTTLARRAVFAPLHDLGRAAQVEQRLAEAIRAGLLVEGERLPSEPDLAAMLGVAVVTAREALTGLRAQGLVTTTRGRGGGTTVSRRAAHDEEALTARLVAMSRAELHDRTTHYLLLTAGCAELAAERADAEEVDALRELLVHPDEPSVGRWRQADAELTLSVAALTGSATTTREVVRLEADVGPLVRVPLLDPRHRSRTRAHHERLVDAVARGDGAEARQCTRSHLRAVLVALARVQAEGQDRAEAAGGAADQHDGGGAG